MRWSLSSALLKEVHLIHNFVAERAKIFGMLRAGEHALSIELFDLAVTSNLVLTRQGSRRRSFREAQRCSTVHSTVT